MQERAGTAAIAGLLAVLTSWAVAQPVAEPAKIRLRVVSAPDGAPVPGVRARFTDHAKEREHPAMEISRMLEASCEAFQARCNLTSGGDGYLHLPPFRHQATVAVWHGDRWGIKTFSATDPGPFTLTLFEDQDLAVRVVARDGAVQSGVGVALRVRHSQRPHRFLSRLTGADGLARFQHLQLSYEHGSRVTRYHVADPRETQVSLSPEGIFSSPPNPVVRWLSELGDEPLTLTLPEVCRVEVRVRDARGRLVSRRMSVGVDFERKDPELRDGLHDFESELATTTDTGLAVFLIRPGEKLGFWAADTKGDFEPVRRAGQGPTRANVNLTVDLVLKVQRPVIVGRALAETGPSLAGRVARLYADILDGKMSRERVPLFPVPLDDEARFRIPIGVLLAETGGVTLKQLRLEVPTPDGGLLAGSISCGARFLPGENDLGELWLRSAPVLVSGTVRDSGGRPVRGARVSLSRSPTCRHRRSDVDRGQRLGDSLQTDDAGRYHFPAQAGQMDLRVQASMGGHVPAVASRVASGSRNVDFTLRPEGIVLARLILDEPYDARDVAVVLSGEALDEQAKAAGLSRQETFAQSIGLRGRILQAARIDHDGSLRWQGLLAGRYCLEVRVAGLAKPLVRVPEIEVSEGRTVRDERLQQIDLRGKLATLKLGLEGSEEISTEDLAHGDLAIAPASAGRGSVGAWTRSIHPARVVTVAPVPPLVGWIPGYRWFRVREGDLSQSITLRPGICLRVSGIEDLSPRLRSILMLEVSLLTSTEPGVDGVAAASAFHAKQPLVEVLDGGLILPGSGTYRLRLVPQSRWRSLIERIPIGTARETEISVVVPSGQDVTSFSTTLKLDIDELEATLGR